MKREPGVIDTRTGKVLITRQELLKMATDYFGSKTDKELQAIIDKERKKCERKALATLPLKRLGRVQIRREG